MGAICSTATPAPKKRETKFDVTKSPPGSPSLNHKASLKGWLDGLDVAGDTKRNLHDIYSVDAIKAMQEELQKRNSKFVEESPPTDKKTEETEEEGGQQEEGGTKKEKKFYV
eukprot:g5078.t1